MFGLLKKIMGEDAAYADHVTSEQVTSDHTALLQLPDHPVSIAYRPQKSEHSDPEKELKELYDLSTSTSETDLVTFFMKSQQIQSGLYPVYTYEKVKAFWQAVQATNQEAKVGHFIYLLSIEALKQGKLGDLLQSFPQERITYTIASLSMLVEQEYKDAEKKEDNILKTLLYALTNESLEKRPDQDLFELAVEFNKAYTIFTGYDLAEQTNQALGSIKPNYDQIHFIANLTGNTLVNFQMILVNLATGLKQKGPTAHVLLYDTAFPGRALTPETSQMIESVMQKLDAQLHALAECLETDPHRVSRQCQQLLTEISEDSYLFFCTPRLGHHKRVPEQFQQSLREEVTDVYRVIDLVEIS